MSSAIFKRQDTERQSLKVKNMKLSRAQLKVPMSCKLRVHGPSELAAGEEAA